jgi:hypothetical protein
VLHSNVSSQRPPAVGVELPAMMNSAGEGIGRLLMLELVPIRVNMTHRMLCIRHSTGGWRTRCSLRCSNGSRRLYRRGAWYPTDVSEATLYLMQNTFMAGATISIDGGRPVE